MAQTIKQAGIETTEARVKVMTEETDLAEGSTAQEESHQAMHDPMQTDYHWRIHFQLVGKR